MGGYAPPIPLGGLRPPLLALRAITGLLWRLCLQTSAALRRRASGWRSSKASILHAPPPWDGPIGSLGFRLPYPSQWNANQSVSVPGGNQRHPRDRASLPRRVARAYCGASTSLTLFSHSTTRRSPDPNLSKNPAAKHLPQAKQGQRKTLNHSSLQPEISEDIPNLFTPASVAISEAAI